MEYSKDQEIVSIFDEIEKPEYYSKRAIKVCALLFSPMFATVMMAMNMNKTESGKKGIIQVIIYGVVYTAAQLTLGNMIPSSLGSAIFLNGIGGYILIVLFWDKYIGKDTQYHIRSITAPAIIGIIIMGGLLALGMMASRG